MFVLVNLGGPGQRTGWVKVNKTEQEILAQLHLQPYCMNKRHKELKTSCIPIFCT